MIIQQKNDQYFMTLPKKLVEALGWKKGDNLDVKVSGKDKLELIRR